MAQKIFACMLGVALLVTGCRYVHEDPNFEVNDSALNWIEIHYANYRRLPLRRVRLKIDGNGFVDLREGTSALVSNSFAANSADENWHDMRQQRLHIEPDVARNLFQRLVDAGLFEERWRMGSAVNTNEAIFVYANFNNHTTGSHDDVFTTDPDLAENLKNTVMMFYHPSPRRRRAGKLEDE